MPVSLGVVSLWAPTRLVEERNRDREAKGENRDYMVPLMERPREIALEVLKQRGVPLLELDTRRSPEDLRKQVLGFRDDCMQSFTAFQPAETGLGGQVASVSASA